MIDEVVDFPHVVLLRTLDTRNGYTALSQEAIDQGISFLPILSSMRGVIEFDDQTNIELVWMAQDKIYMFLDNQILSGLPFPGLECWSGLDDVNEPNLYKHAEVLPDHLVKHL